MARLALIIAFLVFGTLVGCGNAASVTAPPAPDASAPDTTMDTVDLDVPAGPDRPLPDDTLGLDVPADQVVPTDVAADLNIGDVAEGSVCAAGFTRCGDACIDTSNTVTNCGACGTNCRALQGVDIDRVTCARGVCVLDSACLAGRGDCDGVAATGCEADLTAATNCGRCGAVCSGTTPICAMQSSATRACSNGCTSTTPTRCGSSCVDTQNDLMHCGGCGQACVAPVGGRATCTGGVCNTACSMGQHACDGRCVPDNDPNTCGSRCMPCPSGPVGSSIVCTSGACDFVCGAGLHRCGSACIATSSVMACGTSCSPCPTAANADPTCDGVSCGFRCRAGFGDCDRDPSNGCETDLGTNVANCGRCDNRCVPGANASATCIGGTCGNRCNAGFGDCNMSPADGCEASFTSVATCGGCATRCSPPSNATPVCGTTGCDFACAGGFHRCGSVCASNMSPTTCGTSCSPCTPPSHATATCDGTSCDFTCDAGYTRCGSACVDTRSDAANCGACGRACSFSHAAGACVAGSCALGACTTGYGNCDGDASNGCERNLWTDSSCGSCASSCSAGYTSCLGGTCLLVSRTCGSSFFNVPCGAGYCAQNSTCGADRYHCICNPGTQAVRCDGVPCPIAGDCNGYNWWCQPVP